MHSMHPILQRQLIQAWVADLHRDAERDQLARGQAGAPRDTSTAGISHPAAPPPGSCAALAALGARSL